MDAFYLGHKSLIRDGKVSLLANLISSCCLQQFTVFLNFIGGNL